MRQAKSGAVAVGVDIGGTSVKLGLVDRSGKVLARSVFLTREVRGRAPFMQILSSSIRKLCSDPASRGLRVQGVGIGAPGPIDVRRGLVYFFPNIPGWDHTPLRSMLSTRIGMPVFVDNDANAMALAEYRLGAGKGVSDMIALTLGTGIGGGLVIGGRLFSGPTYSAAEIGHLIIADDGPLCGCGNRGCVETFVGNGYFVKEVRRRLQAGQKSILREWTHKEGRELTPLLVAQAARRGDALAKAMWTETGDRLGTALAGLVNILNPQKIVLGGGIALNGSLLFDPVVRTIRKKSFPIAARSVKVVPAKLGTDAGLIGAACLVFQSSERTI